MSGLKEKAKIIMNKPWLYEEQKKQQIMELFEDAQKEIDELKQKLQQLFKEFPDINSKDYALHNGWTNHDLKDRYGLFIEDVHAWKKKFEGLLKEKEAIVKDKLKREEK